MIENCLFFKEDDNTKTKKNASFFQFFSGKERGANLSRSILHPGIVDISSWKTSATFPPCFPP
ncbi:MAG: hypothetical protein AYP45_01505 [Candidatus Brocadia carolinensis]|uniref:Uncharacterized protein n=1 Tax=Candidatus Brocadia carolinensis TaxID=1004156 RepID=A0A1V4AXB4_9BACT|nr:MAG: hypothetical protein AYP45_01505 [Candidatus Brocadia caroliniensis]